ncbi:unnamed protein product [Rhizoctonia solani]|uniref:PH domain-containing protein n=1 Tax=Rhizoctonia solani TaxID=456999 RepID=A0A8H3GKP7_9AGAM|nr:unnamed protein product [Rhizoctonia solani]
MNLQEVITGAIPYSQCINDAQVILKVVQKVFPERSLEYFADDSLGNGTWRLLTQCWDHDPILRPTAQVVLVSISMLLLPLVEESGATVAGPLHSDVSNPNRKFSSRLSINCDKPEREREGSVDIATRDKYVGPLRRTQQQSINMNPIGGTGDCQSIFGFVLGKSRELMSRYSLNKTVVVRPEEQSHRLLSRLHMGGGSQRKSKVLPLPETMSTENKTSTDARVLDHIGEPDYSGWMRKKGGRYNSWKLRYFVLKGPHLYYLENRNTKIEGYVNITGYKVVANKNANPGWYGFRIVHNTARPHFFSSEEQVVVREWMKALMKATILRNYNGMYKFDWEMVD